jgi:hypothetical protein
MYDNSGVRKYAAEALGKITGKNFGDNRIKWQKWWGEKQEEAPQKEIKLKI